LDVAASPHQDWKASHKAGQSSRSWWG
jgi:hypothetical protein